MIDPKLKPFTEKKLFRKSIFHLKLNEKSLGIHLNFLLKILILTTNNDEKSLRTKKKRFCNQSQKYKIEWS